MPVLLQIDQIHKTYGPTTLLDQATASLGSDQKIGLIGRNGCGKSTLCRIITGHEMSDSGRIVRNSKLKLSYLEQHDTFEPDEGVIDFLVRTTQAQAWNCGAMAAKFQIENEMLNVSIDTLSGGYRMRVKLTAMLLQDPNFLLLDEPSNFLDLSTMILLENFLLNFRGGHLIVSHDREFLKRTCDHTLELENGELSLYPGNIEEYFEFKEEQLRQKQAYNRGVEKKKEQLQAFVDRFRAKASTATRAQSKMKQMEKLKTIEIAHELGTVKMSIPSVGRRTGVALKCDDLAIGYPEKEVASGIHFHIDKGERVAVLGDNGEGKTTFLRTISGGLPVKGGFFKWAQNQTIAYYAQHVFSVLDPQDNIYSYLMRQSEKRITHQEVLNMAGCFLFKGDDTKKQIKVLSGGERARLVLAGLLLTKSDVLLLDEPTNHLDFETVEALGKALRKFDGTVFFISHDRTFVNLVATNILDVKNRKISRYPGTYEDYVYYLECVARHEKPQAPKKVSQKEKPSRQTSGQSKPQKDESAEKKQLKADLAKAKRSLKKAEQRVHYLTEERDKILSEIRKNPFHFSKDRNAKLKHLQVSLEEAEAVWFQLQEQLETSKKK
jgi:ATP-binding cassette, subfamily F, member 3